VGEVVAAAAAVAVVQGGSDYSESNSSNEVDKGEAVKVEGVEWKS